MLHVIKNLIKAKLYGRIGVRFNQYGVPFALAKYLKGQSSITLVDVGAHQGVFTTAVDHFCGISHGLLIEAQPSHVTRLLKEFPQPKFQVVHAAVSDVVGQVEFEVNGFDATTSILKTKRHLPELAALDVHVVEKIICQSLTLDAIYSQIDFGSVDLLKIDVQGAEHLVLRGAHNILTQTKMIWTEISFKALYEGSCLYNEVFDMLNQAGFKLHEIEPGFRGPTGELLQADALFIRP